MKKRTTYKLLSMLLVFVLLLPSFSFVTFAGSPITESMGMDTEEPVEIFNPDEESDTSSEPESIEILNRRARNVKHFRHEDGTIEAIIYGYAVHRQDEDGNWQDIDNRLIDSVNGNTTYYTTDDNRIRFTNTGVGQLTVTLDSKPYRITMGMLTNDLQSGEFASDPSARPEIVVRNHPVRAEQVERMATDLSGDAQIELLKKIDNRTELCYRNIQDGIHLKYELEADDIKETIVVNEPQANYIYRFGLRLDGLTAILRDDGGIDLTDSETGETPYRIPAPFMVDANDEISYDVAYTLEQVGDGAYLLTVTADSTWIDARDRAFPVSIDPSVSTSVFADTYIEDNHPDTLHGSGTELWVGSTKYTYIRPENVIPTIPRKAIVNYAFLYGYYYYHSTVTSGTFELAEYRATQDWAEDLTWTKAKKLTNMGFNPYRCYDTVNLSGSAGAYYSSPKQFSLVMKDIVQYWADGYSNYGVVLKRTAGSLLHSIIVSSEGRTAYRPYLVISYTEPWIDNAVYRLKNAETGLYLTVGGGTAYWRAGASIQQDVRSTAEDKTAESRKQLFKIYKFKMDNGDYYYTVRLMTNSALSVSAPLTGSRAAVAKTISVTDSWSEINSTERWLIKRDGAYVTLYNGGYLTAPQNTTQGAAVSATSAKTNYSKWILERYTGGTIQGMFMTSFSSNIMKGSEFTYQAVLFTSIPNSNGPIIYEVQNEDGTSTDKATIDRNSGELYARKGGLIKVRMSYQGASTHWTYSVSIDNTIQGVPTYLRSNSNHYCIPCAITNIAAYWYVKQNYTDFGCGTNSDLDARATEVQNYIINQTQNANGYTQNANINIGFQIFTHRNNGYTYGLTATNRWEGSFTWETIIEEIDAGRPIMLGFSSKSKYGVGHMTVCVGYEVLNGVQYVYVSDAHESNYVKHEFRPDTYNDFISIVVPYAELEVS